MKVNLVRTSELIPEWLVVVVFFVFMWPVLLVSWLDDRIGWTLGIGWGSVLLIVALIVRGAL